MAKNNVVLFRPAIRNLGAGLSYPTMVVAEKEACPDSWVSRKDYDRLLKELEGRKAYTNRVMLEDAQVMEQAEAMIAKLKKDNAVLLQQFHRTYDLLIQRIKQEVVK